MKKSNGFHGKGRSAITLAAAIAASSSVSLVHANTYGLATMPGFGVDNVNGGSRFSLFGMQSRDGFSRSLFGNSNTGGGRGTGDAAVTWDGGTGANNLWSTPANWAGDIAPSLATDDPTFGPTPAGNYSVFNDLSATTFNNMVVNRSLATETTTLLNGYKGNGLQVVNGRLVVDGGTSTIGTPTSTNIAIAIGTTATSNAHLVIQNGANVTYSDALSGFNAAAVTSLTVTGTGTVMTPITPTFDTFFGAA